jgi:ribA/ribD-fused uncharacterized protein
MKITDKHIFFYVEWPSNFAKTKFTWEAFGEKHEFFCTEQAFMWAKAMYFNSPEEANEILKPESEGNTPMWCKQCGRWVKNYDDKKWDLVRYSFMYEVNLCKYQQDKKLQEVLLDPLFDGKTFVEASPTDCIWGIGLGENDPNIDDENNWRGKNLLGRAITEVRKTIIHDKLCVKK